MCQEETNDWIGYITDKVYAQYEGRRVVLWGKYIESDNIKRKLKEKYQISTAFYVESNIKKIDNLHVFPIDCLEGKSSEFYVVIPLAVYPSIRERLQQMGYREGDYYYFCDCILHQEDDYYEDAHGNKIIGIYQGLKFVFSGFNSVIEIGENVKFQKTNFYVHSNSQIVIGDYANFQEISLYVCNNSKATVGNCAKFQNSHWHIESFSDIDFSNDVYLMECSIHAGDGTNCKIGSNCYFKGLDIYIKENSQFLINEDVKVEGKNGNNGHRAVWFMDDESKLEIGGRGKISYGQIEIAKNAFFKIGGGLR